jgi:uncharacterized FlaG/YvyC family protein
MQQVNQMSVTRALVELKTLQDRITRSITQGVYLTTEKGIGSKSVFTNFPSKTEAEQKIQASFNQVDDLISRREKIKAAIIKSNALTTVELNGNMVTVAEAIELKATVGFRETYLAYLRSQLNTARANVEVNNQKVDQTILHLQSTSLGGDKSKWDESAAQSIAKVQEDSNKMKLFDPQQIEKKIEQLQNEVQALKDEVNFLLSESNAKTVITIE